MRVYLDLRDEQPAENGLHFTDFSDQLALKEVIVGHRSTWTRAELQAVPGDDANCISLCKARLDFKSYSVVNELDQSAW